MKFTLFLSLSIASLQLFAQNLSGLSSNENTNGNVYAIVVGISKYENPGIPSLSFAHRDAEVFASYLASKSGGSVPVENIRTFLNEKATYAAIYEALTWVLDTAKENDLVYFYFSGHGDMENETIHRLGFLLSYNSPRTNYLNSAVRIEDLNNFANTISVRKKAKIILITDACHSGDLAGKNFRASMLVGEQLRSAKEKEIRITSCAPDQLSVEDEGWGGGRGVFSYYLINGLQGEADRQKDGAVTVKEIKFYLDSAMKGDALLAQKAHVQSPAITGNDKFNLALVDPLAAASIPQQSSVPPVVFLKPLARSAQSYYFDALEKTNMEELYDFGQLNLLGPEDLPFAFLSLANDSLKKFLSESQLIGIRQSLQQNPDALKRFISRLVVLLSDRGQQVINDYLSGDEAELERRRYYNSRSSNYDAYPKMFAVALKLAQPGSYLADILKVKYHYFEGVAARLKIPLVTDPSPLIAQSLKSQLTALELEKNAAYIHNELGVLYSATEDLKKAEQHFERATQIAPTWSIPAANLSGVFLERKQYDKAIEAANLSLVLQPRSQGGNVRLGLIHEQKKNFLLAEEFYRTSIELNTRHYFPFERLGSTYLQTTEYALADSFLYEADVRKRGYHFVKPRFSQVLSPVIDALTQTVLCAFDTLSINKGDALGNFAWAMLHISQLNMQMAEIKLRNSLEADSTSPLAWHYLGKILYDQQRWMEADIMFDRAITYHLEKDQLQSYAEDRISKRASRFSNDCIKKIFLQHHYEARDNRYFLASLSEKWGHFGAAESQYRHLIKLPSSSVGPYQKLWTLLENLGRFSDAEEVLKNFLVTDKLLGEKALFAFYTRMIDRFPEDRTTYYHAANFLYHMVAVAPAAFVRDHKKIPADSDQETLVIPFTPKAFDLPVRLPGTNEVLPTIPAIEQPFTDAIKYFLVADSLYEENEARAEINQKTGDLYVWQGLSKKAIPHYKRSVAWQPENADTRMKWIRASVSNYKMGEGLAQLDSLQKRNQLNFDMHLLMTKFTMHASRFNDAQQLLKIGSQVYPFETPVVVELQARLKLLQEQRKEAINFYKKLLVIQPNDANTLYSIARLYAQMNNDAQALRALKQAIAKGFNYSWVLKADDSWNTMRNRSAWKSLTESVVPKSY